MWRELINFSALRKKAILHFASFTVIHKINHIIQIIRRNYLGIVKRIDFVKLAMWRIPSRKTNKPDNEVIRIRIICRM